MNNIKPWVGNSYSSGALFGYRTMVLAESNYDPDGYKENYNYENIVIENVSECVFNGAGAFFTKVAKLLLKSEGSDKIQRKNIEKKWNEIIFHNYVQHIFTGPRQRPTEAMWSVSGHHLLDIINKYNPQVLIVLGIELKSRLINLPDEIHIIETAHPSSVGFSYEKWSSHIRRELQPLSK